MLSIWALIVPLGVAMAEGRPPSFPEVWEGLLSLRCKPVGAAQVEVEGRGRQRRLVIRYDFTRRRGAQTAGARFELPPARWALDDRRFILTLTLVIPEYAQIPPNVFKVRFHERDGDAWESAHWYDLGCGRNFLEVDMRREFKVFGSGDGRLDWSEVGAVEFLWTNEKRPHAPGNRGVIVIEALEAAVPRRPPEGPVSREEHERVDKGLGLTKLIEALERRMRARAVGGPPGGEVGVHFILHTAGVNYAIQGGRLNEAKRILLDVWERNRDLPGCSVLFGPEGPKYARRLGTAELARRLAEVARFAEGRGIRFWLLVGTPAGISVPMECIPAVLNAAPTALQGFYTGETISAGRLGEWARYLRSLIEVARAAGKRIAMHEHRAVWADWPRRHPRIFGQIFSPENAAILVPIHETNWPANPAINMGACVGLWLSGRCRSWGMSVQNWYWWDLFRWEEDGRILCPLNVLVRMFLVGAALGATCFQLENSQLFETRPKAGEPLREGDMSLPLTLVGLLYRIGILRPVSPAEIVSISSVAIQFVKGSDGKAGLFRAEASNYRTPPYCLQRILYNDRYYHEGMIPATPHGFFPVWPPDMEFHGPVILTDGNDLIEEGRRISAEAASGLIRRLAQKAARSLPVCVTEEAFWSAWRDPDGGYTIIICEAEERHPEGVTVTVKARGGPFSFENLLTGKRLGEGGSVSLDIPPGGFAIVKARPIKRGSPPSGFKKAQRTGTPK